MSEYISCRRLQLRSTTRPKKTGVFPSRLVVLFFVMLVAGSAFAQQDPNDQGGPDSLYIVIQDDLIGPDDSGAVVELYAVNDAQSLRAVTVGMEWTNPNVYLDSVVRSPGADSAFDAFYFYREHDIDSSNFYRQFSFVGISVMPPHLPPSAAPRLLATYYFGATDWGANDSCCIDTLCWTSGYEFVFVDSVHQYIPAWGGSGCAWAEGFPTECFGTLGNVMLLPECDSMNQTVDIVDLQLFIDHQFLTLYVGCVGGGIFVDYLKPQASGGR